MGKKKTTTSAALVIRHAKQLALKRSAEKAQTDIHAGMPSTTIFVPDLGAGGIYSLEQLGNQVDKYQREHGLTVGTAAYVHFRWRMDAYREAFAKLETLYQQWRRDSGIELAEQIERDSSQQEREAWVSLLARLRSGKNTAPITRYLAAEGQVLEPWKMRQAFNALSARVRRA